MKPLPPRRLRMQRSQRLQAAPSFIHSFAGKRLVLGYAKWFGVDRVCAIKELRMLHVDIAASEEEAARAAVMAAHSRRERRRARATAATAPLDAEDDELDETAPINAAAVSQRLRRDVIEEDEPLPLRLIPVPGETRPPS